MGVAPEPLRQSNAPGALSAGSVLENRFVIQKLLGSGGMGEVYEAEDLRLNRARIALKIIRSDYAANPAARERFQREVLLARSIAHPNVCPVYEIFVGRLPGGEIWFLTMKLLTGETLSSRLRTRGTLPLDEAIPIARQIAAALDAAHAEGVVHRDLKPGNVFLEDGIDGPRAVVTDFGLAKSWSLVPGLEKSSILVGTPGYIAPELLTGAPATPRSDIYSFGVLLDNMIFGRRSTGLPQGDYATEAIPDDAGSRRALEVIRQCREPKPELRFSSAAAAIEALQTEPGRSILLSRRKAIAGLAAGTAVAAAAWYVKEPVEGLLHPVPRPRRVALLASSTKKNSADDASLLGGLLDSVGYALLRAEPLERDLFVVPPRALRQQGVSEASDVVGLFGVNLILRASLNRLSNALRISLDLLRPSTNSAIRNTAIACPAGALHQMPALLSRAAADLLGIRETAVPWQTSAARTNNSEASAAFEKARDLMSYRGLQNIDKAIAELKKAVEADPQFAEAYAALGQAYSLRYGATRDSGALELGERNVTMAFDLAPGLPAAYASRAAIALNRGNHEHAIQDLETAAHLDPENGDVQLNLAHAYASSGKLDLADRTYERLLQQHPNDWTPLNDWGKLYYNRSNYVRAEQLFRQAIAAAPQAALPLRNLGAVYLVTDQMDNARRAFDRSIALLPSGEAYDNRGTALFWLGRYREAAQAYKAAVDLNPNRYEFWGNWGDAYQMLGDSSEARNAWRRAAALTEASLAVNAKSRDALSFLALYQAKLGNRQEALQLLKRLDALGPLTTGQLFLAALSYELIHEREMALDLLKQLIGRGYSRFEIEHAPELHALRKDTRFRKLVE